jgi:hypothetical protein
VFVRVGFGEPLDIALLLLRNVGLVRSYVVDLVGDRRENSTRQSPEMPGYRAKTSLSTLLQSAIYKLT